MIRRIIEIDEVKCNGCGVCAEACHEGAIGMVNGKARLLRDDFCDGLGDCLPECPTGAISFVEREAAAYDEEAVAVHLASKKEQKTHVHHGGGCPGSRVQAMSREEAVTGKDERAVPSQLSNWPVQIKLAPVNAPYFEGCDLLVAADCTAYAYGDFHDRFIKGRVTLIGCPKLDATDYSEKLTQILAQNDIRSIALARMIVPCCGGLEHAVRTAIANSGKDIPLEVIIVGIDGVLQG